MLYYIQSMSNALSIALPESEDVATRVEWAGERIADMAEGILSGDDAKLVVAIVIGWGDLCDQDARRQYLSLAGRMTTILQSIE